MVNRFTNLSTSQFNPLSLNEIMSVPLFKQQQHDLLQQQSGELGLFNVKSLPIDSDKVSNIIGDYDSKLSSFIEELNKNGINSRSKNKLIELSNAKRNLLSDTGELGLAQSAYNAYQNNVKEQEALYKTGKISKDKFQRGINNALTNYKGIIEKDTYNPFTGVHDTDYVEEARKIAKDIQENPTVIEQLLPLKAEGGMYVDIKTGQKYTPKDAIKFAIKSSLLSNSNIMSDLKQREQLGLFGENTTEDVIDNIANTFEATYGVNENKIDRSIRTNPYALEDYKAKLKEKAEEGIYNFEKDPAEELKISNLEVSNVLGKILNNTIDTTPFVQAGNPFTNVSGNASLNIDKKYSIDNLNEQQKEKYYRIYKGLLSNGMLVNESPNSKKAIEAVKNYIDSTSDIAFTNKLIKDGTTKIYGDNSIGIYASNPEKIAKDIILNSDRRYFYSKKDNKVYTKEQMIDKGYLSEDFNEDIKRSSVTGYYDAENYFGNILPDKQYEDKFVSPYQIKIGENNFLVSRSAGEIESKSYKGELDYNKIYRNTTTAPSLPYKYRIPNTTIDVNIAYIPQEDKFVVNRLDNQGNNTEQSKVVSREELRDWIQIKNTNNE